MARIKTIRCKRKDCGGNIVNVDGESYCLLCGRPYKSWADYGRQGGKSTVHRYGRDWMAELGRRGGLAGRLATLSELRQQTAPEVQYQLKGGGLPNSLKELKELWQNKNKRGSHAASFPEGG